MSNKRNALGRGLGAILKDTSEVQEQDNKATAQTAESTGSIADVEIKNIVEANPFQPRNHFDEVALNELAESIKLHGIIQPITVRVLSKDQYQIISGERRFRASKLAGLTKVPVYIRTADDQGLLEMALIENIQRQDLNAIEIALSYQRLLAECNLSQENLGDRVGKNRSTVTNYLRLLKLPPDIQAAIRDQKISMGHARAIISLEDIGKQLAIFNKIIAEELSVRQVEDLVRALQGEYKKKKEGTQEVSYEIKSLQSKLSSYFGTRVQVKCDTKKKGEIKIPFVSEEDLNRLLEIINL